MPPRRRRFRPVPQRFAPRRAGTAPDQKPLIRATDHGRGHTTKDWSTHGKDIEGAQDTWIAFVSPRFTRRGEWRGHPPLHTNQIAATAAGWLGLDWNKEHPAAGKPIAQ